MCYQHILVAVDDSSIAHAAVEQALQLAKSLHAKVTLMSVVAVDPSAGVDFYKVAPAITDYFLHTEESAQARLAELKQSFVHAGIEIDTHVIHGVIPAEGIIQVADQLKADLIMMGSHGRTGFKKMMLGSVAQNVLTQARIPVLVVRM